MNENSPIWARLADTVSAVRTGWRKASTMMKAASDLPTMMMASTESTASGSRTSTVGSKSIPTDTKNNTANASLSGSESLPAWWASSDSERMTPAKNAPSANDTPNKAAEP